MKIGYLEDEAPQAELVKSWLEGEGYQVFHADTGLAFLDYMADNPVDMLVLDWQLPDMEGLEVLSSIKSRLNPNVPVIFATQRDAEKDIVTAFRREQMTIW